VGLGGGGQNVGKTLEGKNPGVFKGKRNGGRIQSGRKHERRKLCKVEGSGRGKSRYG